MIEQPYPYFEVIPKTYYAFQSVGEQGTVTKIVQFTPVGFNIWNLGFADLKKDGTIDGLSLTNNQDALKVLRTVAKIAIDFLTQYPNSILEINPADEKRRRVYNKLFQKHFEELELFFNIFGIFADEEEIYTPSKFYDKFQITFK